MKHLRLFLAVLFAGLIAVGAARAQATKLVWTTPPTGAVPGSAFQAQPVVEAQDAAGVVDTNFNGAVTVNIKAGTDIGGAVLLGTTTVSAASGVATFTDLSINQAGSFVLQASATGLTTGETSVAVVVSLADVWNKNLSTKAGDGIDPTTQLSGLAQIRSMAVNSNPGSSWKGTLYLPRRANQGAGSTGAGNFEGGPGAVFYWTGAHTLQAGGPNFSAPDGTFDVATLKTLGFDITTGNYPWAIGVGGDDYVYVTGLGGGKLARFNPDGTNPVIVIASGLQGQRQIYVTGRGITTTIWFMENKTNPTPLHKWVASAVDGTGAPTAFTEVLPYPVTVNDSTVNNNQLHQLVINTDQTTLYYTGYLTSPATSVPQPQKYSLITGARDTAYPAFTLSNATGVAIDSQDRMALVAWTNGNIPQGQFNALSPRSGVILTDDGTGHPGTSSFFKPAIFTFGYFNHYIEIGRYSDRHYFYIGNDATGATPDPTSHGTTAGVIATDMPAPAPRSPHAADAGQNGKVNLSWTLPNDPEVTGVKIYRSTASGPLSAKTLIQSNAQGTSFQDSGLTNGQPVFYTLRCVATDPFTGTAYESANLDEITATPTAAHIPPDAPGAQAALDLKDGGRVKLTWTDPATNLDHINIYQSTTAGALGTKVGTVAKGIQQLIISGLTDGTPYYFTIKGANGAGDESANTAQVTATPTDTTAPTFAGIAIAKDYGLPGFRLSWTGAVDNTLPITYLIYTAPSPGAINYSVPTATTTSLAYDLNNLPIGQDIAIAVRARDAVGNVDTNTNVIFATPLRSIADSDVNANVNWNKINFQPDSNFPALVQTGAGSSKGNGVSDLVPAAFTNGVYYFNTNDKKGKVQYTLPITAAGNYDISVFWNPDPALNCPGYKYQITLPNGTVLPVITVDQLYNATAPAPTTNQWNLLTNQNLTPGNLVILGDATGSTDSDPAHINVSGAVRALLTVAPTQVPIYQATGTTTIDGNISDAEWKAYPSISLGHAYQDVIGGKWSGPADYTANVKIKWDSNNLYVAEKVTDDVLAFPVLSTASPLAIWNNEALEVYLGLSQPWISHAGPYVAGDYQVVLGGTTDNAAAGQIAGAYYSAQADFTGFFTPTVAMVKTATGYTLEASIPWGIFAAYPSAPAPDSIIGFNLHGDDNDNTTTPEQDSAFSLSGASGSATNPAAWITAKILASAPPAPVKGDVNGDGSFTAADIQLAFRIAAGLAPATEQAVTTGDVFPVGAPDGKIELRDVLRLERAFNGKDTL